MQPTYFPWAGYFNLIAQADEFVFLDDVQLEKQSWQTRNRLILNGLVKWITVPIRHQQLAQTIAETQVIDANRWREKLAKSFNLNYGRHIYYSNANELIDLLLSTTTTSLAEINESIIRFASERLKLTVNFHRASSLGVSGIRSAKLVALCEKLQVSEYLSPLGSAQYLEEDKFSATAPAALTLQNYQPQGYQQKGSAVFHSHLSILDVVANVGWEGARKYVIEGCV